MGGYLTVKVLDMQAFASADAVIKAQTGTAFTTQLCKTAGVTEAATAIANAISKVHTSALAKVDKCYTHAQDWL